MSYWTERSVREQPEIKEVISRSEYRDILLARMAAGDLYASETLSMVRKADMALDILREKPIYKRKNESVCNERK